MSLFVLICTSTPPDLKGDTLVFIPEFKIQHKLFKYCFCLLKTKYLSLVFTQQQSTVKTLVSPIYGIFIIQQTKWNSSPQRLFVGFFKRYVFQKFFLRKRSEFFIHHMFLYKTWITESLIELSLSFSGFSARTWSPPSVLACSGISTSYSGCE